MYSRGDQKHEEQAHALTSKHTHREAPMTRGKGQSLGRADCQSRLLG